MRSLYLTILTLIILQSSTCWAQTEKDTIQIKQGGGTKFMLDGKRLTPRQLTEITRSNPAAYQEMKIARSNNVIGSVFGSAGGFLAGYQLGAAIGGGKPNWAMVGVGAGLVGVSLPFSFAYTKHAKQAVRLYNAGIQAAVPSKVDVKAGIALNHLSLRVIY